jgi:flagellar biosynthetic protein FlhB
MSDKVPKDERTEDATPRKREEAREKGQVAISNEVLVAAMLGAAFMGLALGGGPLVRSWGVLIIDGLRVLPTLGTDSLELVDMGNLLSETGRAALLPLGIFVLPILAVGLLAGFGQVGFRLAPKAVSADLEKISPTKGFSRLFSAKSAVKSGLALLKILVIGGSLGAVAVHQLPHILNLSDMEIGPFLAVLGIVVMRCAVAGLIAIAAIAVIDFFWQRRSYERDLRMTRKELRDEMKNTEGDPHLKGRIRQIQREMASRRMMADVPKATVVVTNPTHYAVALTYDRDGSEGTSPVVVAKGVDHVAQHIKSLAREANVPLFEDVPLARALHARSEIGQEIPEDLYQAVAGVLAWVYRLRGSSMEAISA